MNSITDNKKYVIDENEIQCLVEGWRKKNPMNDFTKVQHGFMEHPTNKLWAHSRRCNIHGHHGRLYICPYYGRALINKIKKERSKWKKNPVWRIFTND